MSKAVKVGQVRMGGRSPLVLIAGPCVIESRNTCVSLAGKLARLAQEESIPFIFKASYDKANRSSFDSYRGPGLAKGLEILREIKEMYGVPVLTDVHSEEEVGPVAEVVDILQIPAFLCRQTDLVVAAGESGKPVNIKKGQFVAPEDTRLIVEKVLSTGNKKVVITERGTCFGYNNLVADMRSLLILREMGYPVVFDATHSVQRPGAGGKISGGDSRWAGDLARAAVATGCDSVFIETHTVPAKAMSDKANCIAFSGLRKLWGTLRAIDAVVQNR